MLAPFHTAKTNRSPSGPEARAGCLSTGPLNLWIAGRRRAKRWKAVNASGSSPSVLSSTGCISSAGNQTRTNDSRARIGSVSTWSTHSTPGTGPGAETGRTAPRGTAAEPWLQRRNRVAAKDHLGGVLDSADSWMVPGRDDDDGCVRPPPRSVPGPSRTGGARLRRRTGRIDHACFMLICLSTGCGPVAAISDLVPCRGSTTGVA